MAIAATEIFLRWSPPNEVNRNGEIASYDIRFEGSDMNDTVIDEEQVMTVKGRLNHTLKDLHEYTEYEISIRASTLIGSGPYSSPIRILTNESSK